ncbi:hypothetical protein CRYPA_585 [uncultured Candidatus Thioglobus sp.]|nr:hypothetical protein CRYPA_585 [uncultured Candidatus Thioglobus sp.]
MKKQLLAAAAAITSSIQAGFLSGSHNWNAGSSNPVYRNFPITLSDYSGFTKHSVSYKDQMARHVLHNS